MNLTFNQLRNTNVKRCESAFKHSINDWSPSDWAMATTGELGELCNLLKKMHRGEAIPSKDIADEIADTMIYLDLLAARLGVDLGAAVISKFNEVSDRKNCAIKIETFDQYSERKKNGNLNDAERAIESSFADHFEQHA